jgi:hypothetical protein
MLKRSSISDANEETEDRRDMALSRLKLARDVVVFAEPR